jgi:hypothetical protein
MGPPGLEVSNTTPVSDVLAWIDPDEDTEILVPEMHTTGTPNVLNMGSEYLDAAAVYDRTQGMTQAVFNAEHKKVITETKQVSIAANNDFFYADAKTGYHLLSIMFLSPWSGRQDTVIGLTWSGYNYIGFLHAADASARTKDAIFVWVENA